MQFVDNLKKLISGDISLNISSKQIWALIAANMLLVGVFGFFLVLMSNETSFLILSTSMTLCAGLVIAVSGYITWAALVALREKRLIISALDKIDAGVMLCDFEGKITYQNTFFSKTFPGDLLAKNYELLSLLNDLRTGKEKLSNEPITLALENSGLWTVTADTSYEFYDHILWTFSMVGGNKNIYSPEFVEIFRDYEEIFESAPQGIVLLDAHARILRYNYLFKDFTSCEGEHLDDSLFFDLLDEACRQDFAGAIAKILSGESVAMPLEVIFKLTSGRSYSAFVAAVHAQSDEHMGIIIHIYDNTVQKNVNLHLVQSQKMQAMGQLAGGIAHDFNNLLTAMIGFCDLLLHRHSPGDQSFTDIMQIKQNANRAANLVRQLLAFSKQQTLQPQVLSVSDILSELNVLLQRLLGVGVILDINLGRDTGLVKVDKGQLEQVIINLAVNARDAMDGSGELRITTAKKHFSKSMTINHENIPSGTFVEIKVKDNGTGISQDNLSRIFDPFFSTKELGHGTGLGLSTVYGIVKQTGGAVLVDTELGKGTEFTVLLPAYKEETIPKAPETEKPKLAADLTGSGVILFVEDEDSVRLFGARALRDKGYKVFEARNGQEALSHIDMIADESAEPIDLVITDVVMPGIDGPTLVKQIHEKFPNMKVIFISGYAEDSFRQKVGSEESIDFLPKPFSLKALAVKVKEVLETSGTKTKTNVASTNSKIPSA